MEKKGKSSFVRFSFQMFVFSTIFSAFLLTILVDARTISKSDVKENQRPIIGEKTSLNIDFSIEFRFFQAF